MSIVNLRLLIAYGSLGKLFHLKELADELEKHDVQVKLIKDTDYSRGFPSRRISDWINGDKDIKKLIKESLPLFLCMSGATPVGWMN